MDMGGIPGFDAFDHKVRDMIGGVKKAKKDNKVGMLILYILFVLFLFFVASGALVASFGQLGLLKDNLFAPEKSLTYKQISQEELESGRYKTTYEITVLNPDGYNEWQMKYYYPFGCEETWRLKEGGGVLKGGVLYAEGIYETICITDTPINDTGNLFRFKRDGLGNLFDSAARFIKQGLSSAYLRIQEIFIDSK